MRKSLSAEQIHIPRRQGSERRGKGGRGASPRKVNAAPRRMEPPLAVL